MSTLAREFFHWSDPRGLLCLLGLATGDGLLSEYFLRPTGVSPLVPSLSSDSTTIPCVGWAIVFPYITFRSHRAAFSVQVHPCDEVLSA